MVNAYLLDSLTERLVQLVHEPIDGVDFNFHAADPAQVIHGGQFAAWLAHTRDDKVSQHAASQLSKADVVIDAVKKQMRTILHNGANARRQSLEILGACGSRKVNDLLPLIGHDVLAGRFLELPQCGLIGRCAK